MTSSVAVNIQRYILIGLVIFLFFIIAVLQQSIRYSRITEDIEEYIAIVPGEFVTNLAIGGFRGLAADFLWLKVDDCWHSGRWYDVLPLLRAITWMQPHFLEAWEVGGWHMAYNLYAYAGDAGIPDREKFIDEGIRFLKEGLARNRNVHDLWFNLGWIYYNKLENYDEAIRYFRSATKFKHPNYIDRLIAHAYRKKGDIEGERREWQRCLTVFTDDSYHIDLSKEHLEKAEKKLK